jgi:hypothetical protein
MKNCYKILRPEKYCSIVIRDFIVDKKEICVQADIVEIVEKIGFEFVGTIVFYKTINHCILLHLR